ncbi:hypothetical protein PENTCL1PPCAC_25933, partial [Pristionchus entomophagus]
DDFIVKEEQVDAQIDNSIGVGNVLRAQILSEEALEPEDMAHDEEDEKPGTSQQSSHKRPRFSHPNQSYHEESEFAVATAEFCCRTCGNTYKTKKSLSQHLSVHTNNRKSTQRGGSYDSDKKKFPCSLCIFAFDRATALADHMNTHTGE